MPPSKANVIETLASVKNLGETYATAAYEDLGVRSVEDLIEAAKAGKLQSIKGVGAAKEKAILKSAQELAGAAAEAPKPEAKKPAPKSKAKKDAPKKAEKPAPKKAEKPAPKKAEKPAPKKAEKPAPKKAEKPAPKKSEKPAPKKEAPKKEEPKAETKKDEAPKAKPAAERPRTTYRPPQPKPRPSIPGLVFKLAKKIIGRILS